MGKVHYYVSSKGPPIKDVSFDFRFSTPLPTLIAIFSESLFEGSHLVPTTHLEETLKVDGKLWIFWDF